MNYKKVKIGQKTYYVPRPRSWWELRYTLHNEEPIMDHDPNNPPDYSDIAKLF